MAAAGNRIALLSRSIPCLRLPNQHKPAELPGLLSHRRFPSRSAGKPSARAYCSPLPDSPDDPFLSPEDYSYLWKLAAGSVGGASVIKYGSVLYPEMTRPNILQALLMISLPVLVAVLILIRESSMESESEDLY